MVFLKQNLTNTIFLMFIGKYQIQFGREYS